MLEKMEDLVALIVNNITIEDTIVDKEVSKGHEVQWVLAPADNALVRHARRAKLH